MDRLRAQNPHHHHCVPSAICPLSTYIEGEVGYSVEFRFVGMPKVSIPGIMCILLIHMAAPKFSVLVIFPH